MDSRGPLNVVNEGLLRHPFFQPRPTGACAASEPSVELRLGLANQFFDARDGPHWAFLDAETYRLDVAAALPLGAGRELRVEIPFHSRVSGILDRPIEGWHNLLGFEPGTRPAYPRNRVHLLVGSDSLAPEIRYLLAESEQAAGLGDLTVTIFQRIAGESERYAAALRAGVKLPTGRIQDLFGSGAADLSLGVALTTQLANPLWLHGNLDAVALGRSELAGRGLRQPRTVSQLLLGLEWRAGPVTRLLLQAQSASAPLAVRVPLLDRESLLLAVGVRRLLSRTLAAELALGEDLRVQTGPDLSLHLGLRWSAR